MFLVTIEQDRQGHFTGVIHDEPNWICRLPSLEAVFACMRRQGYPVEVWNIGGLVLPERRNATVECENPPVVVGWYLKQRVGG